MLAAASPSVIAVADTLLFRVHRSAIQPALDAVFEAVDHKATIPILGNVLLRADKGDLLLRGTDLGIEVETSCELLDQGTLTALTVSGNDLREIVRNLPESAEIAFTTGAFPDQVRILSGRSKFSLLTLPEKDFPSIASQVTGEGFDLDIPPFIDALGKVTYAIREDKTRQYLSGACLHPESGDLIAVVGCDGHNLAVSRIGAGRPIDFPSTIVPLKTVKAIKKLFGERKGKAEFTITDAMIRIRCGGVTLISKLIEGTFPGYAQIIPPLSNHAAVAPVSSLKAAVSRVCLVANDLEKDTVRLQFERGSIRVSLKTSEGKDADEEVPIDFDGEPIDIGFNGRYLTAMLSCIGTQDVAIHLSDATRPGLFRPTIEANEHFILMPRKL